MAYVLSQVLSLHGEGSRAWLGPCELLNQGSECGFLALLIAGTVSGSGMDIWVQ